MPAGLSRYPTANWWKRVDMVWLLFTWLTILTGYFVSRLWSPVD
jgi:hypothetical protein